MSSSTPNANSAKTYGYRIETSEWVVVMDYDAGD